VTWRLVPAVALLLGITVVGAHAGGGDPVRGEKVFQYCYSCHSMQPDEINLQGPNLWRIVDCKIASQEGFPYSPALRAFAQREDRWSEALLDRYLTAPYKLVPKTSMAFPGIEAQDERADLIAYLRSKGNTCENQAAGKRGVLTGP
jgi:cytochrome c